MLLEGFVALIALATIMMLSPAEAKGQPAARIYGDGLAASSPCSSGRTPSSSAPRSGRWRSRPSSSTPSTSRRASAATSCRTSSGRAGASGRARGAPHGRPAVLFLHLADARAYLDYWNLFGTSNQLLAALTLLAVTVWLHRTGRRVAYVLVPMVFVMSITVLALLVQIGAGARDVARASSGRPTASLNPAVPNGVVALALLLLAALFVREALKAVRAHRRERPALKAATGP